MLESTEGMRVVFHESFLKTYTSDPAAGPGRLDYALDLVKKSYPLIEPHPCSKEDVLLVHSLYHLESVQRDGEVFPMALLAAGAAVQASQFGMEGEPAFALCRPPGHHASPDSCWGFCYFNNIAIAVQKLFKEDKIKKALIVDFDLHFGDGTSNIFKGDPRVSYFHVEGRDNRSFVGNLEKHLESCSCDLVAVSAGFDRHVHDWGRLLDTENYGEIGALLGAFSREKCRGRLFAALEGGYNPRSLGESLLAFLNGIAG